jgi:hypothetical protein
VGYGSDDESGDNYQDNKVRLLKKMFTVCFHIYRLTDQSKLKFGIGFNTEVNVRYHFGIYATTGPGRSRTIHNGCQIFRYVNFVYVLGCNF